MKNIIQRKRATGFTVIEMIAVMVIITVILGAVLTTVQGATNTSRITSTLSSIKSIQTACVNYYNANGGTYTNGTLAAGNTLSLANLASNGMLPAGVAGTNAWGGAITVAPDANANYFDITLSSVPTQAIATSLNNALSNLTQTAPAYAAKTQTWSAAF